MKVGNKAYDNSVNWYGWIDKTQLMKHDVRSGINVNEMNVKTEATGSEEQVTPQTSSQDQAIGHDMATTMPNLPSGIKPPRPLKVEGNLATNCSCRNVIML